MFVVRKLRDVCSVHTRPPEARRGEAHRESFPRPSVAINGTPAARYASPSNVELSSFFFIFFCDFLVIPTISHFSILHIPKWPQWKQWNVEIFPVQKNTHGFVYIKGVFSNGGWGVTGWNNTQKSPW